MMNCIHCGNPLEQGAKFCGYCGQAAEVAPPPTEAQEPLPEEMPTHWASDHSVPTSVWSLVGEAEDPIALGESLLLGRSSDCDLMLTDTEASRVHALIQQVEAGYTITDQGSTNGTLVNEQKTAGAVALNDGDVIRIGNTRFTVSVASSAAEPVCSSCGSPVEAGATFCGSCGHPISVEAQPAPVAQVATPQPVATPAQPAQVAPVIEQVSSEDEETPAPKLRPPRRGLFIGCGVMLVLVVAIVCCVSTVGSGLLEFLLDLIYEIQDVF